MAWDVSLSPHGIRVNRRKGVMALHRPAVVSLAGSVVLMVVVEAPRAEPLLPDGTALANQEEDQKVGHEAGLDSESPPGFLDLDIAGKIVLGVSMDAGDLYHTPELPFGHLGPDKGHNAASMRAGMSWAPTRTGWFGTSVAWCTQQVVRRHRPGFPSPMLAEGIEASSPGHC